MKSPILRYIVISLLVIGGALCLLIAWQFTSLHRSVKNYAAYWGHQAQKPIADNAQVLVVLGDSAAQGIGASKPEKGYVSLVAMRLSQKHKQPVHVINLSVTGAKVQDAIRIQLPQLASLDLPDQAIIILEIGANDMRTYQDSVFAAQMETLVSKLPKTTIVADVPYFGAGRYRHFEKNVLSANAHIRRLVQKYNLRFAHLHEATDTRSVRVYAVDFLHPNDRGYRNWAKAFDKPLGL